MAEANDNVFNDTEVNSDDMIPAETFWEENQLLKRNYALLQQQCNNMGEEIAELRSLLAVGSVDEQFAVPRKLPRVSINSSSVAGCSAPGCSSPANNNTNVSGDCLNTNNNNFNNINSNSNSNSSNINNTNNIANWAKKQKKVLQAIDTDISKLNSHLKANNCTNYIVKQSTKKAPVKIIITDEQEIPMIKQHLANAKVSYHEYKWDSEKRKSFIIKGLVGATDDDIPFIKNELILAGLPEHIIVSFYRSGYMRSNPQLDHNTLIQLTLPPNTDTKLIGAIKYIDHVAVKIEPLKNSKILKCKNCQLFGHAASGCQHVHRCVKCGANHYKNDCPRTTNKSIKLHCCNCGGEHTANNVSECSAAQQYINNSNNYNINTNSNNYTNNNSSNFNNTHRINMRANSLNNGRRPSTINNNRSLPTSIIKSNFRTNSASPNLTRASDSYPSLPSSSRSPASYKNLRFSNTNNASFPINNSNSNISYS